MQLVGHNISQLLTLIRQALIHGQSIPLWRSQAILQPGSLSYQTTKKGCFSKLSLQNCFQVARIVALLKSTMSRLQEGTIVNKRTVYYQLIKYYKDSYSKLDEDLRTICFNLGCQRVDLLVQASSKCLVNGSVTAQQKELMVDYRESSCPLLYQYSLGPVRQIQAVAVLIVQKQAIMQVLLNQPAWKSRNIAIITAKGYPDYSARSLVTQIGDSLPVYYLGDYDPFGADILLQYSLGSPGCAGEGFGNPHIHWLQIDQYIQQHPHQFTDLEQHTMSHGQQDKSRIGQICGLQLWNSIEQAEGDIYQKLRLWKHRLQVMRDTEIKVELQGIWKSSARPFGQLISRLIHLNYYL